MRHKIKACSKLGVAIAAAMGLAGQAEATVDLDTTPVTPATFASEIGTATATLTNTGNILDLTFTPVAHELNGADADNVYFIKVELANKATFGAAPVLKCNGLTAGANKIQTAFNADLKSGGANTSFAMFEVYSGLGTSAGGTLGKISASACTLSVGSYKFSGTTDKTVTVTNLAKDALGNLTAQKTFSNQPFISFANGLDATATSANVTISVTAAAQKFANNKTTAQLGTAQFGAANGTQYTAGGAADAEANDFITAASVTLSGAPLGPSISFSTAKSGIYLVAAGKDCTAGGLVKSKYDSSTGNSVTFTGLTPGQISAGFQACVVVDGNTIIPEGTVTVSISPKLRDSKNSVSTNFENTTVANYKKNGDSATAFLITKPGAVDVTYLRITNNSSLSGTVRITLYGEDGSTLGTTGASLGTWNANETKVISSQDIADAVGVTTWTGRARAVIDAELSDIVVVNLVRTNDVLTNQSSIQD